MTNSAGIEEGKHPFYELIVAWASGKIIQWYNEINEKWYDYEKYGVIHWHVEGQRRIKPDKPKDLTRTMFVEYNPTLENAYNEHNLKLIFDGETGQLKGAELLG